MLTSSHIFLGLISSTFVSDLYGRMQRLLCLICITPYYIFTVTLEKHRVIKDGTLYGVSYFYVAWLVRTTLSPTL